MGLTSRKASKVVPCATGITRPLASNTESSCSAMPSALDALEQRWGNQHDSDAGVSEALVDLTDELLAERDEPERVAAPGGVVVAEARIEGGLVVLGSSYNHAVALTEHVDRAPSV